MQKFGHSKFITRQRAKQIFAMSAFQQLLTRSKMNRQASDAVSSNLLPGTASKLVPGAGTKLILPERGMNVSAKVPVGQPIANLSIPEGIAVEDSVTVVVNTVALGLTSAQQQIVLFDEGKYFQAYEGLATPFPANSVYVNTAARNLYNSWVAGLCGQTYLFSGVKIDVAPAAGAAATALMQYQERIICYNMTTRKKVSHELPLGNFNDPANYDRNTYIIPLTDEKSRVDRNCAWVFNAYHGMVITMTFFVQAYARD